MDNVPLMIGLDYSSSFVQMCVMDEQANVLLNRGCDNDWRELVGAVKGRGVVKRVAIEACCGAADLAQELVDHAGWHVELAHPGYVAKLKGSPDKTDYTDARLLADLTRVGYLPRTWLAPLFVRELRQLVGYRQQLVDQRRAAKLRIGALLRERRVVCPKGLSRWTKAWQAFARVAEGLGETGRWIVGEQMDLIDLFNKRITSTEGRLRQFCEGDAMTVELMGHEGIGEVTAWTLRAFVGNFDRFKNGKQLSRYCGLSPCNASSGTRQADAGLIRGCNRLLRSTIIQAAHRLIRTSDRWSALAASMKARGKPACVVAAAVGNRWIRALHHQLTGRGDAGGGRDGGGNGGGDNPAAGSFDRSQNPASAGGKTMRQQRKDHASINE